MIDQTPKPEEGIIVRTMKGDLLNLDKAGETASVKPVAKPVAPPPLPPTSKETEIESSQNRLQKPPVLVVPPKIIPPREVPQIPTKPLYKTTPAWIRLGIIGLAVVVIVLSGLYGYWKIFIQSQPPAISDNSPSSTSTTTALPIAVTATTTAPIRFFNKLPTKSITIDLPSKTSSSLVQALKSEAKIAETLASIKQLKVTYQGKPITTGEFFNLMSIFTPKDFLSNYEDEFAFAYFSQKEGARPILVLKAKDKALTQNQMTAWESTTLTSDIFSLFLSDSKLPQPSQAFKSYLFIGQPIRYLNIGMSYASLNYAIYNNFLIFTTSSAGMFVTLQDLTGQTASLDYKKSLEASIDKFVK